MALRTLRDLFVHELNDARDAERQLLAAFPSIIRAARDPALKEELDRHWAQTRAHEARIDRILEEMDVRPNGVSCDAMRGLLEEADRLTRADELDDAVRDAALVATTQKIEHYEIAAYGTLRAYAERLGESSASELLGRTLEEEAEVDRRMTRLANDSINADAMA